MATESRTAHHGLMGHGASRLPAVNVDSYNLEIKDNGGFLGDRACKKAFQRILDDLRKPLRKLKSDPFGDTPSEDLSKRTLDAALRHECVERGVDDASVIMAR